MTHPPTTPGTVVRDDASGDLYGLGAKGVIDDIAGYWRNLDSGSEDGWGADQLWPEGGWTLVSTPITDGMTPYVIDGYQLHMLLDELGVTVDRPYSLRVAIDDGGVKFKLNNGSWSPALGTVEK